MTREHAARMLLAHGALTAREFIEITGWPDSVAYHALERLFNREEVRRIATGKRAYLYELAA